MRITIIRPDDTIEQREVPDEECSDNCPSFELLREIIGCRMIEHVAIQWEEFMEGSIYVDRRSMFVDEEGLLKDEDEIKYNHIATVLYHRMSNAPLGSSPVVGTVVVLDRLIT